MQLTIECVALKVSASSVSPSPEEAMEWARSKYGTVSTFAEVEGPNRISILLQGNSNVPSKCELNQPNMTPSPLVRSSTLPKSMNLDFKQLHHS